MSVSTIAVELAAHALGELRERSVLVIGAGENGELTARALHDRGVATVFVANRRYDRAIGLAQRFGGHAIRFEHRVDSVDCAADSHGIAADLRILPRLHFGKSGAPIAAAANQ